MQEHSLWSKLAIVFHHTAGHQCCLSWNIYGWTSQSAVLKLTTGRPHIRQEVKVALVQSKTCGASHSQSDKGKECSLTD